MADSILRLKVESQEYDAKIQRAVKGIQALADSCHKAGGGLTQLSEENRNYVRSLGSMETVARSARGRMNELTAAFTDLRSVYNSLSQEEKQSEFGKELNKQLETLKQRVKEAKAEMNDINRELGNTTQAGSSTGSVLDQLTSKLGISVSSMLSFGTAVSAAKVALDVAKDAFFQSESNIDEWGRTVEGAKGAYSTFLNTINSGNWSNFFSNLSTAVQGARDLYDALDRLGSVKSNNQAAVSIQQQQIAQLRLMKQQGQNVDEQLKAATERLRQLQNQSVDAGKVAGHATILNTLRNRVNAGNTTGVNIGEGTLRGVAGAIENRGQAAFDQYKRQYDELTQKGLEKVQKYDSLTKSYYDAQVFNLEKLSKEEQKRYLIAQAVTEGETEIQKGISIYAQAVSEGTAAAREEFKGNRYALQGAGGTGGKGTSPQEQAAKAVADAQLAYEQAIKKAQMEFESGAISDADVKKKTLAAQENLWSAYGKAYNTYADPKYKEAQDAAATEIVRLGGEVKAATEAQEAAKKAARELEAAQKKAEQQQERLAEVTKEVADAVLSNDLKGAYAAQAKAGKMGGAINLPVDFTYTQANLDAFAAKLKTDLAAADVGSLDFNRIMGQMADANALGNFMKEALAAGVDMAQLEEVGQTLWQKIFAEGADIPQDFWQQMFGQLGDATGKDYQVDNDGSVTAKEDKSFEDFTKGLGTVTSALGNVSNGLKSLGVEIPKEVDDLIGIMQSVGQIISGVQAIISLTQTPATTLNTTAIGLNTAAIGSLIAAMETNTMANLIPGLFAGGGIVPKFAAGGMMIPGNSFSGDNLRMPVDGGRSFIGVNSGELILNRAQAGVLASELDKPAISGDPQVRIEGEDLYIVMSNFLGRANYGEIVTTNRQ